MLIGPENVHNNNLLKLFFVGLNKINTLGIESRWKEYGNFL